MADLLPCPFCGATAANGTVSVECFRGRHLVECGCGAPDCGCGARVTGPGWYAGEDYFETEAEAIAAWNRREPGWTSVSERLPEYGMDVLVRANGSIEVAVVLRGEGGVFWSSGYVDGLEVTHWMPLPKPPGMTDE